MERSNRAQHECKAIASLQQQHPSEDHSLQPATARGAGNYCRQSRAWFVHSHFKASKYRPRTPLIRRPRELHYEHIWLPGPWSPHQKLAEFVRRRWWWCCCCFLSGCGNGSRSSCSGGGSSGSSICTTPKPSTLLAASIYRGLSFFLILPPPSMIQPMMHHVTDNQHDIRLPGWMELNVQH